MSVNPIREIGAIVAAIGDRDPDAARRACVAHVEAAAAIALTILAEHESAANADAGAGTAVSVGPEAR